MSTNNGWFYTLTLKTDKNSFQEGNKAVDSVSISVTRLLGTVRNAVPLIAEGIKMINGNVAETYATGAAIGFSTQKMEAWSAAAKKAGVNADGLFTGIKNLKNISAQVLEMGNSGAAQGLAEPLGWLGITDINEFLGKSPEEKIALVFDKARKSMTEGGHSLEYAAQNVGKILGSEYSNLFTKMQTVEGTDFFGWINQYLNDGYLSDENAKKALGFNREWEDAVYIMTQLSKFAGTEFGASFTPLLKELNEFMRSNKDGIKEGLQDLAEALSGIADALVPILGPLVESGLKMFVDLLQALKDLLNGDWEAAGKNLQNFFLNFGEGIRKAVFGKNVKDVDVLEERINKELGAGWSGKDLIKLSPALQNELLNILDEDPEGAVAKWLRWNYGQSIQALREARINRNYNAKPKQPSYEEIRSGELHSSLPSLDTLAFGYGLPSGSQINAGGNTINQTININGNADPGMIRESAYDGVTNGLMDAMNTAEQRMQLAADFV